MKNSFRVPALLIMFMFLVSGPALAQPPAPVTVAMTTAHGKDAGTITLTETAGGVLMRLALKNLAPGEHAYHFHEKGACDAPDFESAGGHLNPHNHPHGYMQEGGPHDGDMPNIFAGADGMVEASVLNTRITMDPAAAGGPDKRALVPDEDGAALIVHASPDDYATQPTGNAGGRVACGVVKGAGAP